MRVGSEQSCWGGQGWGIRGGAGGGGEDGSPGQESEVQGGPGGKFQDPGHRVWGDPWSCHLIKISDYLIEQPQTL